MNYSLDAFNTLVAEVEAQAGALAPEPCEGTAIKYPLPNDTTAIEHTCHCQNESVAIISYDPDGDDSGLGAGFARICLVCDSAGAFPNLTDSIFDYLSEHDAYSPPEDFLQLTEDGAFLREADIAHLTELGIEPEEED